MLTHVVKTIINPLYVGVPVENDPLPKIEALHRRIHRVLAEMPADYLYRTTVEGMLRKVLKKRQCTENLEPTEFGDLLISHYQ